MVYHTRLTPDEDTVCDWPECGGTATHPAPRGRGAPGEYHWFCLEHVRAYNANWDYFAGMGPGQIEAELRRDTVWRRPSWPLGGHRRGGVAPGFEDPLGLFGTPSRSMERSLRWPPGSAEVRALATLSLGDNTTLSALKTRYKVLVKRHHPDANGGCRASEERLKAITQAYRVLRQALAAEA